MNWGAGVAVLLAGVFLLLIGMWLRLLVRDGYGKQTAITITAMMLVFLAGAWWFR